MTSTNTTRTRSGARTKVRTKTFTGCWTCRKRKVKCDEAEPSCYQCAAMGISCAGYTARLQWLTPITGTDSQIPSTTPTSNSLRRYMSSGKSRKVLNDHELDHKLSHIEAESTAVGAHTASNGPFSVFRLHDTKANQTTELQGFHSPQEPAVPVENTKAVETFDSPKDDSPSSPVDTDFSALLEVTTQHATYAAETTTPDSNASYDDDIPAGFSTPVSTSLAQSILSTSQVPAIFGDVARTGEELYGQLPYVAVKQSPHSYVVDPFQMSTEMRYLLSHYINNVVDVMTAVNTPKSPWKLVHLPRVLQGSGELAILGSTSHARNALLHALLAISAFNLVSHHSRFTQDRQADKWRAIALNCQARAVTCLKACLKHDCPLSERGKYKEVLAAMLSMITINVCSGDTHSSEWHLKGLESFIKMSRRPSKRRYSGKAQALHRVYFYLRVMRESTDLRCKNIVSTAASPSDSHPQDMTWLSGPLCFLDTFDTTEDWLRTRDSSQSCAELDLSACEFVYGVPFDLLVIMCKTSALIQRKRLFRREFPTSIEPQTLTTMCDQLETEILDWPVDRVVSFLSTSSIAEESFRLIEHQTRAFHQATIIYFSRLVRSIHQRHLQPYARSIIDHLEAIEVIKYGANLTTGCILWPGFIGAAEAIGEPLQSRYLQWFRSTQFYGLAAYDKAQEIVLEVWEKRNSEENQQLQLSGDWSSVIESRDVKLLLT